MGAKLRWIIELRRVSARDVALAACLCFLVAAPVVAQTPAGNAAPPADRREPIIIGGKQPPAKDRLVLQAHSPPLQVFAGRNS
jgi:hypothetical protein